MNQKDQILLNEVKKEALNLLGLSVDAIISWSGDREFTIKDLNELLQSLRVNVKYLKYDVECRQREKEALVKLLDNK